MGYCKELELLRMKSKWQADKPECGVIDSSYYNALKEFGNCLCSHCKGTGKRSISIFVEDVECTCYICGGTGKGYRHGN